MSMNTQGRPTAVGEAESGYRPKTFTGNRGLDMEEPLIFEFGHSDTMGVDLDEPEDFTPELGQHARAAELELPGLAEPEAMRHYVRLSRNNYAIDSGLYPLGSCTMKHNPRLNEKMARLPGFGDIHPLQPLSTVRGAIELIDELARWLMVSTGTSAVAMSPKAGAHGELCGMMAIKAAHKAAGRDPKMVLVPESAHGTNPASCTICSLDSHKVVSRPDGRVDLDDLRRKVDDHTAALMITNPNTCGVFDDQIADIADILHAKGALLYYDGANMNASLGVIRPGDVGVDVMHYNTHKTFSTPHGGGGPGAGPVGVTEKLRPYLPRPTLLRRDDGTYGWNYDMPKSIGRVRSFYGQIGVLVRAYTYIRSLGRDGLRRVSNRAVLNANYVAARLKERYPLPFPGPYAHEFITVPQFEDQGITERDFAKRLLDYGIHPPTMSWPIMHCLMIEPSETESLASLDRFCEVMLEMADEAEHHPERLRSAPHNTPIGRLDEVAANRKPNVRWKPE